MKSLHASLENHGWALLVLLTTSFVGVLLNSAVMYVVGRRKQLTSDSILMMLIALLDLTACVFVLGTCAVRLEGSYVLRARTFCKLGLYIYSTTSFASLTLTSILSAGRYFTVVHGIILNKKMCTTLTLSFLMLVCLEVIGRGLTNKVVLMPSGLYCIPNIIHPKGFQLALEIIFLVLFIPCPFVILISYGLVTCHFHGLIKKAARENAVQLAQGHPRIVVKYMRHRFVKAHIANIFKLILLILAYSAALLPEYAMAIATLVFGIRRSPPMDCFAFLAIFSLVVLNPLFVLHVNENHSPRTPDTSVIYEV